MLRPSVVVVASSFLLLSCAGAQPAVVQDSESPAQVLVPAPATSPASSPAPAVEAASRPDSDEDADDATEDDDDDAPGTDQESALGSLFGNEVGEATGFGGLGLTGTGVGSTGEGIGIGTLGTLGTGSAYGTGNGGLSGGRPGAAVSSGPLDMQGRLPPDVIRRIVRQHLGRIRFCYQRELSASPALAGKLSVRFVIARDGKVSNVSTASADGGGQRLAPCVHAAFRAMQFPQPDGGIVLVTYPLLFRPGDADAQPADAGAPGADGGAAAQK